MFHKIGLVRHRPGDTGHNWSQYAPPSASMRAASALLAHISSLWLDRDWTLLRPKLVALLDDSRRRSWAHGSSLVAQCLVAGEDHRSRQHLGVDFIEMWDAVKAGLRTGAFRGASTIEMQLVRTLTSRRERTARRKVREVLLAVRVREVVPKEWVPGVS